MLYGAIDDRSLWMNIKTERQSVTSGHSRIHATAVTRSRRIVASAKGRSASATTSWCNRASRRDAGHASRNTSPTGTPRSGKNSRSTRCTLTSSPDACRSSASSTRRSAKRNRQPRPKERGASSHPRKSLTFVLLERKSEQTLAADSMGIPGWSEANKSEARISEGRTSGFNLTKSKPPLRYAVSTRTSPSTENGSRWSPHATTARARASRGRPDAAKRRRDEALVNAAAPEGRGPAGAVAC